MGEELQGMTQQRLSARRAATILLLLGVGWILMLGVAAPARAGDVVSRTNLVTDEPDEYPVPPGVGIVDTNLVNAWGISYSPTGPFWVSSNEKDLSPIYAVDPTTNVTTKFGEVPTMGGGVTGQTFNLANASGAFNSNLFLFVSEDGTISGWRPSNGTEILQSPSGDNI